MRKAGATRAAERGATERQLMATFGWSTGKMAQHYTRAADRARLTHDAAQRAQEQNKNSRTLGPVRERTRKLKRNQRVKKRVVPRRGLEPPRLLTTGT